MAFSLFFMMYPFYFAHPHAGTLSNYVTLKTTTSTFATFLQLLLSPPLAAAPTSCTGGEHPDVISITLMAQVSVPIHLHTVPPCCIIAGSWEW